MKINIHAGHNPEGKIACGAIGILNESREARIIKDKVIQLLRAAGHDVLDSQLIMESARVMYSEKS